MFHILNRQCDSFCALARKGGLVRWKLFASLLLWPVSASVRRRHLFVAVSIPQVASVVHGIGYVCTSSETMFRQVLRRLRKVPTEKVRVCRANVAIGCPSVVLCVDYHNI